MIAREINRLRQMRDQTIKTCRSLQREPFQHERISLSITEALKHASHLQAWLDDALLIAESELHHPEFSNQK